MNFLDSTFNHIKDRNYYVLEAEINDGELVFEHLTLEAQENAKVAIVYGDNAAGKSFIGKLVETVARSQNIHCMSAAVRNRTSSGVAKAMVFGDEETQSTGQTSLSVMQLALKTANNDDKDCLITLDEPDIGLSRKYSKALGKYLASQANSLPENKMFIVITHNIDMLQSYLDDLSVPFLTLGVNTDKTLSEWMSDDTDALLGDFEKLNDIALQRWRAIELTLEKLKRTK